MGENKCNIFREALESFERFFKVHIIDTFRAKVNYIRNCRRFRKELTDWSCWDYSYHLDLLVKMVKISEQKIYIEGDTIDDERLMKCYYMRRFVRLVEDQEDYSDVVFDILSKKEPIRTDFASGVKLPDATEADKILKIYNEYITNYNKLIVECLTKEGYGFFSWCD